MKRLSFRSWMSIITLVFIAVIVYFSRHELLTAWEMLGRVDLWVLALILPVAAIGYLAAGEMIFSYLRQKRLIDHVSIWTQMRISMELNFVNHVLPSGGVSGISYVNWRLSKLGVRTGKATMAQAVRYVAGFAAIVSLLFVAVIAVTIDGTVNRWIILMSSTLVFGLIAATMIGAFLLRSKARIDRFAVIATRVFNAIVRRVTFGRFKRVVADGVIHEFLNEMHEDFLGIMREKGLLLKPYLWGIFFTITEIAIFSIVFWALGSPVNPAPILIAYGLASVTGFLVVTPGGAGAYEATMVLVLAIAGMSNGEAIAGIVLTRAIILFVTIVGGYIFYQQALVKYGKRPSADI